MGVMSAYMLRRRTESWGLASIFFPTVPGLNKGRPGLLGMATTRLRRRPSLLAIDECEKGNPPKL